MLKSTGDIRKLDKLGRVVIPIELRNKFEVFFISFEIIQHIKPLYSNWGALEGKKIVVDKHGKIW